METDVFRYRIYGKRELALLYFPTLKGDQAVRKLQRWIVRCTPLRTSLQETDYVLKSREFTARQVRLIISYLGEP